MPTIPRQGAAPWFLAVVLALGLLAAGCATSGRGNQLALGMSKAQVLQIMGPPAFSQAEGQRPGTERLTWFVTRSWGPWAPEEEYFVRLHEGRGASLWPPPLKGTGDW